jgi:hypothetical protein
VHLRRPSTRRYHLEGRNSSPPAGSARPTGQAIPEIAYPTRAAFRIGGPDADPMHELLDAEHQHDGYQ